MDREGNLSGFAKYAWFVLGYNVLVILWGVFLRASRSGDGCGQHWLTCHGEVVPSAPELKTVIEFSHRITSALAGILIIILLVWAYRRWRAHRSAATLFGLKAAALAFLFVIIEGAVGAGLVLTGNTAENLTPARPFWMGAHLLNTLVLLAILTVLAWAASSGRELIIRARSKFPFHIAAGLAVIFLIGISGSIAALCNLIFPSATLQEGLLKDLSPTSHFLLKIRPFHPVIAVAGSVILIFGAGWLNRAHGSTAVSRLVNLLSVLLLGQLAFGAATLLMLSPILMQLGHLFLADAVWITFVLLSINLLDGEQF